MARLTGVETAFLRQWFSGCIARLETLPPSPSRDFALDHFRQQLAAYPASNVVPLFGARQG